MNREDLSRSVPHPAVYPMYVFIYTLLSEFIATIGMYEI